MEKVLKLPLTLVPFSLASCDRIQLKTNKSKLLHKLENQQFHEEQDMSKLSNTVFIIDGNALFHSITDITTTYGELAKKNCSFVYQKYQFILSQAHIKRIQSKEQKGKGEELQTAIDIC